MLVTFEKCHKQGVIYLLFSIMIHYCSNRFPSQFMTCVTILSDVQEQN